MTLEDVVRILDDISDSLTIHVGHPPTRAAEAVLCPNSEGCWLPYFLEVDVAKNVLRAWSFARGGQIPTLAQRCEALLFYAEHDAYILPEHEKRAT